SPSQNGSSIANFELFSTFWLSMDLCDPKSSPFGACVPNSDTNDPVTAGRAFMELQFYPPGTGNTFFGCSDTQWCAALTINKFEILPCGQLISKGNITTDGTPGGPQLKMSNGDTIQVTIHDTANGMETDVNDLTSGATGFMVASGANGFTHDDCATMNPSPPFDFHPMFATAQQNFSGLGPIGGSNIAFHFEVGHFELCSNASCVPLPDANDGETACGIIRG